MRSIVSYPQLGEYAEDTFVHLTRLPRAECQWFQHARATCSMCLLNQDSQICKTPQTALKASGVLSIFRVATGTIPPNILLPKMNSASLIRYNSMIYISIILLNI